MVGSGRKEKESGVEYGADQRGWDYCMGLMVGSDRHTVSEMLWVVGCELSLSRVLRLNLHFAVYTCKSGRTDRRVRDML